MNLYNETVTLLNEQTTHTQKEIAKQSGVSHRWLCYLISGDKKDYGVARVQRVYDFLIKTKAQQDTREVT